MHQLVQDRLRHPATEIAARSLLTAPFWISGLSKLVHFDSGAAEMARAGLEPAAAFNLATIAAQLLASALVISGRLRTAAGLSETSASLKEGGTGRAWVAKARASSTLSKLSYGPRVSVSALLEVSVTIITLRLIIAQLSTRMPLLSLSMNVFRSAGNGWKYAMKAYSADIQVPFLKMFCCCNSIPT